MAYLYICDRCGARLDYARSYYKVNVETHKDKTLSLSSKSKDYCEKCFDEIEKFASNPYASISYNTPGAR